MKQKSKKLNVIFPDTGVKPFQINIITGKKFWYQTVFCAYSLQKVSPYPIMFNFYDDGTFDDKLICQIKNQVHLCTIFTQEQIMSKLDLEISSKHFPNIKNRRKVYPHLRKITDVLLFCKEYKYMVQMDSDLLFFKFPEELFVHLKSEEGVMFMRQHINSYGYSLELIERVIQKKMVENINVGVVGLNPCLIDIEQLEHWINILENSEGTSYFLEQALWAMIATSKSEKINLLDKDKYQVMPMNEYSDNLDIIARHYVSYSKIIYYKDALYLAKDV